MSETAAQVERLQRSVSEVGELRSSAAFSLGMMALGIAVLVGGILYTAARIAPLEQRAAALRTEIADLEAYALASRQQAVQADSALAATAQQFDSINADLARLRQTALTPAAQAHVDRVVLASNRAEQTAVTAQRSMEIRASDPGARMPAEGVDALIGGLFDGNSVTRLRAYDGIMARHAGSPALVPALLQYANEHPDNLNGIYNTLVVLNTVPRQQLVEQQGEVLAFLDRVQTSGPRIRARTQDVRKRLR